MHLPFFCMYPETNTIPKQQHRPNYLKPHVAKALTAADDFDGDAGIEAMSNLLAYDFGDATNALLESAMAAEGLFIAEGLIPKNSLREGASGAFLRVLNSECNSSGERRYPAALR
jgi:hypothetical protein